MNHWSAGAWIIAAFLSIACSANISGGGVAAAGAGGSPANGGAVNTGSGGAVSNAAGGSVAGAPPTQGEPSTQVCPSVQVPRTSLRRLTRFEYANSAKQLLNVDTSAVNDLPVDEVTDGFDNNAAVLTVSSLHAEKYVLVSEALAKLAVANASFVSCDTSKKTEDACAREFAQSFGRRAFRRPLSAQDEQSLMTAYAAGKE